jgi:beta-glucosidase
MGMLSLLALTVLAGTQQMIVIPDHVATRPADRLAEDWWKQRHEQCVEITKKGGVDLVFLGDSITQGWQDGGRRTWEQYYGSRHAANFGFSGDRTEHVLWRLEHGEIIGLKPKLIVIMIGTNNVGHGVSNSEQTADGVHAIVDKLLKGIPEAKILLLGIFPRGEQPDDPMRIAVDQATKQFRVLADDKRVFFQDIGFAFKHNDGSLRVLLMPDRLHLNPNGYEIWAQAIDPLIMKVMGSIGP